MRQLALVIGIALALLLAGRVAAQVPYTFGCTPFISVCAQDVTGIGSFRLPVICQAPGGPACCDSSELWCLNANPCPVAQGFHDSSSVQFSFDQNSHHCCTALQRPCDQASELANEVVASGIPASARCLSYVPGAGAVAAESDEGPGCTFFCGDGFRNPPGNDLQVGTRDDERCDDGNRSDSDGCTNRCRVRRRRPASRKVASGDQFNGRTVESVAALTLNNAGHSAALVDVSDGAGGTREFLIGLDFSGDFLAGVEEGDPVPDRPGFSYIAFSHAGLEAPIKKEADSIVCGCIAGQQLSHTGVCRPIASPPLLPEVILQGDPLPGTPPDILLEGIFGLASANPLAFSARFAIGPGGVTAADDTGLLVDLEDGSGLQLVAREGSPAPGLPVGVLLDDLADAIPSVNAAGVLAFRARLLAGSGGVTPGDESVLYSGAAGALAVVAREGAVATGTAGVFDAFPGPATAGPALNAAGDVAFPALLKLGTGGVSTADAAGVWKTSGGVLELVARAGVPAPGTPAGIVFAGFENVVLNDAGDAAFTATLAGPGIVAGTNDVGVWAEGSALALVARAGDPAPGELETVFGTPFVGGPSLNGAGQVLIHGFLAPGVGDVSAADDGAIWLTDAAGTLEELVREGDVFELSPGDRVTVDSLELSATPGAGGSDGRPRSLSDRGEAAFVARFTDGRSAAYVTSLPSPCGLDTDGDSICDDGDGSGTAGDSPCAAGATQNCDDNCVDGANPLQADGDGDGRGDLCDNCPFYASANLADTDGDGRGDECECTDQNGDGRNTVVDLVEINLAIFNPARVTPLCDGDGDGLCNVADIIAANVEIFSPGNTSICGRQPVPGP